MTRGGRGESWSCARFNAGALARAFSKSRLAGFALIAAGCLFAASATAQVTAAPPTKGTATLTKSGDYARLLIKLQRQVEAEVRTSGSIVIVRFAQAVDVNVDKLWEAAPEFVSSARTDPDGSAIRLALSRKATPSVMVAGERLFIDFLPDTWTGPPPALPPDVIKELAERARAAEKLLQQREAALAASKRPPIRVRASNQPTFTRYVFELPEGTGVSTILNKERLTLNFDSGVSFDLADAKVAAAPNITSITQKIDGETTVVDFTLIGDADVHSFREERNYIVDIGLVRDQPKSDPLKPQAQAPPQSPPSQPAGKVGGPEVAAAVTSPAKPVQVEAAPVPVVPLTLERTEVKPDAATKKLALASADQSAPLITGDSTAITVQRNSEQLRLTIPFFAPTPAAVFTRSDALWMVFDSEAPLDVSQIDRDGGPIVRDVLRIPLPHGQAIRLRLNRPQLVSVSGEGHSWVVHAADVSLSLPQPLTALRNIAEPARASVTVPLAGPGRLHRLMDPDAGDAVLAVTASLPARGFVKRQDFVEFALLGTVHGVAVQLKSDDVQAELAPDKLVIGRPGGLTLSAAEMSGEGTTAAAKTLLDVPTWRDDRAGNFIQRRDELWAAAAQSATEDRIDARLDLARFYLANGFYPEARAVIDAFLRDEPQAEEDSNLLIVRALASILSGAPEEGLKGLANPAVGTGYDSRLWRAMAHARLGKWTEARELFKGVDFAIGALPLELQRVAIVDALRASLEVRDYAGVSSRFNELDIVGVAPDQQGYLALLRGRMAQALGREKDALTEYRKAIASPDRISASEAKLYEVELALKRGEMTNEQALADLETLAVTWRGDAVEIKTLQLLARLYEKEGRFRDALMAARTATSLQPDADVTRQMQDDASALFAQLFISERSDIMAPVQALALFYEFRELTPIGRRGDEMIRRLADRLVAVDLLDQAAELLQYQVDHRLEGSARAHVASRLAMIYLTNRKPDRALAALRATRIADLAGELRQQRLLLEARAQSDVGRHELALDIISNLAGPEAIRLRSDIHWAARRWRESSEQLELLYGERWKDFAPLSAQEKSDIVRAAIGYSLSDDGIGLHRLKEKYAAKLAEADDRAAFDAATKLATANSADFATIARMAAAVDTLDGFLRVMRQRFPDSSRPPSQAAAKTDPSPTAGLPAIKGLRRAEAGR
ncbi:tetratricopeptide repeat protein [Bradyrhizobium sp. LHD-71]|uniref:tetratricopeptide repeat protein n=1 Tax=Bradyrhizobium sp. LHD-71 TaxID=3072141 RepID=UPI00280FE13A|nr:tetratricopeptide repeat protein [Bradyrhizobium sp. LHD-71]MDQ8732622.1 tetratricopeptide repeat protein [Bradyrhizobium sp. LHD-71]